MTDANLYQRIATDASVTLGGQVCDYIDEVTSRQDSAELDVIAVSVVTGAITGALRALKACDEVGMIPDADRSVEVILKEAVNIWGQLQGSIPTQRTVQ